MQTQAIEKYSIWARNELRRGVAQRAFDYGLDPGAANFEAGDTATVNGRVLTNRERAQRTELARRIQEQGYDRFVEEMAYTWFDRLVAIRFMEVHDFLPSRVRMFSSATDATKFQPQVLAEALSVEIEGLDRGRVLELIDAADDEALFRELLLAQCNELAAALPTVFGRVDAADGLMLPSNLLKRDSVVARLVTDVPLEDWDDVEALGWMYQFYNAERKAEFFKSKRKAAEADLAPATQLFTPEWIVRYMVDNSLGRLWMLNHPESRLHDRAHAEDPRDRLMEYYIEPDEEHEDFIRVASPEDITFCDPACGSGHILVYAFKMLMAIYEECGYREREIPELILTKNLSGFEIDPRAAQIATLTLALCAREHDRRFFGRGITADITVLQDIRIDADGLLLASPLREKQELLESLAHLGEIGSLLQPTEDDVAALETDLVDAKGDNLFASHANAGVEQALAVCRALSRRFDVVVANPPYMGSSSFNPFMSKWVKRRYPDSCKDLCTAFIEHGYALARERGYNAMVTMQSWMFLGSFEKMRNRIIDEKAILTMAHLGTRAFDAIGGEVVSVTADVLYNGKASGKGSYVRLVDIVGSEPKREKLLEAIQNPNCGYFYRADATTFHNIPGSPIAYWASDELRNAFISGKPLSEIGKPRQGLATGENARFVREWWEVTLSKTKFDAGSIEESVQSGCKWFPYNKGGEYRKWYGNNDAVVNWENDGQEIRNNVDSTGKLLSRPQNTTCYFHPSITWSKISSGSIAFRYKPAGHIFDVAGTSIFADDTELLYLQGAVNSSIISVISAMLSPTLNFEVGQIATYPILEASQEEILEVDRLVANSRLLSKTDWDSQETSWDFKRSPLV